MKTHTCIIVEDEPLAAEIIETYLKEFPDIRLLQHCQSAMEAFRVLNNDAVDLMFLDIHMPGISGLDFLKSLRHPPSVIITTAYRDYALDGFELDVLDYLLKPISMERFIRAIDKYYQQNPKATEHTIAPIIDNSIRNDHIFLRVDRRHIKVTLDSIYYIEAARDYLMVYTTQGKYMTKQTISDIQKMLPESQFIRIHRSYLVSLSKIKSVTPNTVEIGKRELPVGRSYKHNIQCILGNN